VNGDVELTGVEHLCFQLQVLQNKFAYGDHALHSADAWFHRRLVRTGPDANAELSFRNTALDILAQELANKAGKQCCIHGSSMRLT
jgi:hypothetical protein